MIQVRQDAERLCDLRFEFIAVVSEDAANLVVAVDEMTFRIDQEDPVGRMFVNDPAAISALVWVHHGAQAGEPYILGALSA